MSSEEGQAYKIAVHIDKVSSRWHKLLCSSLTDMVCIMLLCWLSQRRVGGGGGHGYLMTTPGYTPDINLTYM